MDLLRELGGVAFLYNLSKSSVVHSEVKEAALFTLGTLAEANGGYMCLKGATKFSLSAPKLSMNS